MSDGIDPNALDQLAAAKTPSQLVAAHGRLARTVATTRKRAAMKSGKLATAFGAFMATWEELKAQRVSFFDRCKQLEAVLRANFPEGREQPWRYLCEHCDDSGLRIADCPGDATCGRERKHGQHIFGTPCWCQAGARFRQKPKPTPEDFTQAGRNRKMTRLGR